MVDLPVEGVANPLTSPLISDLAPDGDHNGLASLIVGPCGISIADLLIDLIRARTFMAKADGDAQS